MRILIDENLPEQIVPALRSLGHQAKDTTFVRRVEQHPDSQVKLLRVALPQTQKSLFVAQFTEAFTRTDWALYRNGDDWP